MEMNELEMHYLERIFSAIPKMTETEKKHFLDLAEEIRQGRITGIDMQDSEILDNLIERETSGKDK